MDLFPKNEKILKQIQLNDSVTLRLVYVGVGATTKDVIQVQTERRNFKSTIALLQGFSDNYDITIAKKNDSVVRIVLIDTGLIKGIALDTFLYIKEKY